LKLYIVAPSGIEEKNLNTGAQLQIIHCKKPPKHFFLLHVRLKNSISVSKNGGTAFRFWYGLYEFNSFFVTPCNESTAPTCQISP